MYHFHRYMNLLMIFIEQFSITNNNLNCMNAFMLNILHSSSVEAFYTTSWGLFSPRFFFQHVNFPLGLDTSTSLPQEV